MTSVRHKPSHSTSENGEIECTDKPSEEGIVGANSGDEKVIKLLKDINSDGTWWWKILLAGIPLNEVVPWPLNYPISFLSQKLFRRNMVGGGSAWATVAIVMFAILLMVLGKNPNRDVHVAIEVSKILVSGSFLTGTILSVSVAMPGQAIIKAGLEGDPDFAVAFVVPFMWGIMWGLLGASSLLMFYSDYLLVRFRPIALFLALYGACMLLHAITHTIRMYLLGLVLMSQPKPKNDEKE